MVVLKFGGSSLASVSAIKSVAGVVSKYRKKHKKVVVVVSAMGKTTDLLIGQIEELGAEKFDDLTDGLLNLGELKSSYMLAIALKKLGERAEVYNGDKAKIFVSGGYGNGFISGIDETAIKTGLAEFDIIVVAGFCGVNNNKKIVTLGRGGSDTTAVALASVFRAKCYIFTDVCNVCSIDPKLFNNAKKYKEIDYDNMLELGAFGAKVLDVRCLEIAKKFNTEVKLKKSNDELGETKIVSSNLESLQIAGIAIIEDLTLLRIEIKNEDKQTILKLLINSLQKLWFFQFENYGTNTYVKFAINTSKKQKICEILEKITISICDFDDLSMLSLVGLGFVTHTDDVLKILSKTSDWGIEILNLQQCERVLNVLVHKSRCQELAENLKNEFNL
ncbi:MAG: hypothetical protein IJS68_00395 [Clostridia bacterium]|nr:hypothetical protein [Clostridia bacterium]